MIRTTSAAVNVDRLHPVLAYRVELMLADPLLAGYKVVSGVRTLKQQRALYSGWRKRVAGIPGFGRFNKAANPDRVLAVGFDGLKVRGSYHMVQSDGYGHAVDFRKPWRHSTSAARFRVRLVGAKYGVKQTVPGEWWHCQARNAAKWFPGPNPGDGFVSESEDDDMVTLVDTATGEHWVAVAGKARVLSDPAGWMVSWDGPVRKSHAMRYIIKSLYTVVE